MKNLNSLLIAGLLAPMALAVGQARSDEPKAKPIAGSRFVGVSCICYGQRASMNDMESRIDEAALDKPDIVLLTEGCMQNSPTTADKEERNEKSEPLPEGGPITTFLRRKAKQHNTYIFGSYWRKDEQGRGRYNSAVLIDRRGKVVGWYDKMFPTIGEMESGVLPGKGARVFDTDFGRIGAVICFDLNFDELLEQHATEGVELLCFLSAFRGGARVPAIASRNQCFIASSVPHENGVIVDPLGRTLAESSAYGRIIFAKINLDSQVVHIDYNVRKVRALKEKYGECVKIETASPEAVYYLSSTHPEKTIQEMMKEFEIESFDQYLDRARTERLRYLPNK